MAAAGVAVVAVIALIALIVLWPSSGEDPSNVAASASADSSALPSPAQSSPGDSSGGSGAGRGGAQKSGAAGGPDASGSVSASVSAAAGGVATPGAVEPGAPCPDANISVVVTADEANYAPGDTPTFEATVTNAGAVACARDIGSGQQQFLVYTLDGAKQLWASADCTFVPGIKNEVLAPGQQIGFKFKDWALTTSGPGCKAQRMPLAPGAYIVVAKLGEKRSEPVTFNVLKSAPEPAPAG